jgi:hypothetical protein
MKGARIAPLPEDCCGQGGTTMPRSRGPSHSLIILLNALVTSPERAQHDIATDYPLCSEHSECLTQQVWLGQINISQPD